MNTPQPTAPQTHTRLNRIAPLLLLLLATQPTTQAAVLWSIGTPNGSPIEFAPGSRDALTFEVGTSVASRDFAGQHHGSVGFDGQVRERPYTIRFDLPAVPARSCQLLLDLIYRSGAPQRIQVSVNDRRGIFPVRPAPKASSDGEEANAMLLAQQQLLVEVPASWLVAGRNQITITPLGLGYLDYDAIRFVEDEDAVPVDRTVRLRPTIFFLEHEGTLNERCELEVPFQEAIRNAPLTLKVGTFELTRTLNSGEFDFGVLTETLDIPVPARTVTASIEVRLGTTTLRSTSPFQPAKQWKVFVCPKVHNDVGYTDLQPHVNELDNRNTDTALEIMDRFPFYRFNFETSWLVENYLDCRSPAWQERFISHAAEGRAVINAFYLNLMTGICTGEELYRAMYYTHALHRQHGSNFDFACLTDAPSHTWFLPSLLSEVGVRAFSNGSNQTRAPILHFSHLNEDSPFYWEGLNGERILMWFARSYTQWKRLTGPDFFGSVASLDYLHLSVPQFLNRYLREDYVPDAVMIYGAYVDNAAIPETGEAELVEAWNRLYAYPQLVVASDAEYFNYIEQNFRDRLPIHRGDAGAYWEDGVASSAQATRLNRQTQQTLPIAETAAAFATWFNDRNRYPLQDFHQAWKNVMFYDEHTWGAHNSVSQPDREFVTRQWEIKESYATRAHLDARNLLARGFNRFCQNIAVHGDTVLAFNFQNWPRTAPLEVEIGAGQYLVDLTTDTPVPLDLILAKDGYQRVRFLATDVPPMGYRGYAIRSLTPPAAATPQPVETNVLENQFYRLVVDLNSGGLKSAYDKRAQRELIDPVAPYTLNQYLYVTGGEGSLILNHTFGTPPADLTIHSPSEVRVIEHLSTPLGERHRLRATAPNTPLLEVEYRLYHHSPRIDIVNTFDKQETRSKEAVYFAFPFAATRPEFACRIQNGWCRPNEDQLPGACREWFTPQNVVHLRDSSFDIAWASPDVPLVTLTDINRGRWPTHLEIRNGHLFSYALHNYWFTNYRAQQGGHFEFRYSITSGTRLSPVDLARFDVDTRSPVVAYPFVSSFSARAGSTHAPLASTASLIEIPDPNLQVVVLKAAEDGDGFILRLQEISGTNGETTLEFPYLRLLEAHRCNGMEVPQEALPVTPHTLTTRYQANRYLTLRLKANPALPAP